MLVKEVHAFFLNLHRLVVRGTRKCRSPFNNGLAAQRAPGSCGPVAPGTARTRRPQPPHPSALACLGAGMPIGSAFFPSNSEFGPAARKCRESAARPRRAWSAVSCPGWARGGLPQLSSPHAAHVAFVSSCRRASLAAETSDSGPGTENPRGPERRRDHAEPVGAGVRAVGCEQSRREDIRHTLAHWALAHHWRVDLPSVAARSAAVAASSHRNPPRKRGDVVLAMQLAQV
jgi:hypothetical protein